MPTHRWCKFLFVLLLLHTSCTTSRAREAVDFNRDIRPILSDKCFHCHGPDENTREAELRLDTRTSVFEDRGGYAAVIPGDPGKSELFLRITASKRALRMPPKRSKLSLSPSEIERIRLWIEQGAPWAEHWAYVTPQRPSLPKVSQPEWLRNPIDAFVLARLDKEGLRPSSPASKEMLLRRVTLDLTGLPPTVQETDAFLDDSSPNAYEKVVDRLLASPHYGERMAWDWLDAARYADTNGFQGDPTRTMWPWRDWLTRALNSNQPFDRFTIDMLAGDLLPEATLAQKIATGFNRNHMINGEGGRIAEETRIENVFDRAETTATVWLGLTMTCCRCHDHKYERISQKEYYQLFAFFNNTSENGQKRSGQTPPVIDFPLPGKGAKPARVMIMDDLPEGKKRQTYILTRGLYNQPTKTKVDPEVPSLLPALPTKEKPNRLTLAKWLVAPTHPLTARVTVNRYWQTFFGTGIVKTTEDFGVQGAKPSHPELLDYLATEFIASGWDVKAMHKLIVTSATYRQSSKVHPELQERDPENRLLARASRFRRDSWMLRDQALAVSGLLVTKFGGPPVQPYQPAGIWAEATFNKIRYKQDTGEKLYRRSIYTFWRRIVGPTMFFDSSPRQTCSVKPTRTNTPLHALTTLNETTFVEAARALAERVMLEEADNVSTRVSAAFRRVTARVPSPREQEILVRRWHRLREQFQGDPQSAERLLQVGESSRDPSLDPIDHAAYTALCSLILNLDEVLTRE